MDSKTIVIESLKASLRFQADRVSLRGVEPTEEGLLNVRAILTVDRDEELCEDDVRAAMAEVLGSYFGVIIEYPNAFDGLIIDLVYDNAEYFHRYECYNEWVAERVRDEITTDELVLRVMADGYMIDEDGVPRSSEELFEEIAGEGVDPEDVATFDGAGEQRE